ncbi:DUF1513 domain-containing protein [Marinobacter sp. CA1]|uniref:DUF1513 domain-containing protein n=1 Tax=Marinobacter sp. CA1 TaxID=2817656 RepID=UPI001D098F10|nr:DUF1513 domain-containing protein [Marinobacter sp. CA1]UDL06476.1 DUF1513 domain-containing protein [Marinobacter sp. CA1]
MLSRRRFLQWGLAGLSLGAGLPGCALAPSGQTAPARTRLFSAADTEDGRHALVSVELGGAAPVTLPVPERCHGGCPSPDGGHVVLFARRPGRHFYVIDSARGDLVTQVAAGEEHHFYGHGVFSPDGSRLYTTMNHYPSGDGLIGVYDVHNGYRLVDHLPAGGIGPHELRLHPDGETLVVAVGGIQTHPDYDRIKLNLDTMAPALVLIDRHSGQERQRYQPSHHQLSCRHLDVSPEGIVIAGYQYQGPRWHTPPLIARLDSQARQFSEIELPSPLQASLNNYTASIAIHPRASVAAITAPRGGRTVLVDYQKKTLIRELAIPDCAGALPDGEDGFLVTSGIGRIYRIDPRSTTPQPLQQYPLRWDNHLTPFV